MTALTKDRNTVENPGDGYSYPVAAGVKIFAGALVCLDASGNAEPGSTSPDKVSAGRAESQVDNTSGAAGAVNVVVRAGTFRWANADGITKTSIGDLAYIVDDQTVAKSSSGKSPAGVITGVDAIGVWVQTGSQVGEAVPRSTQEAIVIDVDLVSGVDPSREFVLSDQASVDAYGAFATLSAVIDALPENIGFDVTIRFSDGVHVMGNPDWGRLRFSWSGEVPTPYTPDRGSLTLTSLNGRTIVSGTAAMAVTSSAGLPGAHAVTLAADPGLVANTHRDQILEVVSGTGAGQFKPIRSHTGATFNIAGEFLPALDATSVVEIRTPAAEIEIAEDSPYYRFQKHTRYFGIVFDAIDLTNANAVSFATWDGGAVHLIGGARVLDMLLYFNDAALMLGTCVLRGISVGYSQLVFNGGYCRTAYGTSYPMLMRANGAARAITMSADGKMSHLYLYGGQQFDDYGTAVLELTGPAVVAEVFKTGSAPPQIGGTAPTNAVVIEDNAIFVTGNTDLSLLASGFQGSTSDIKIDGAGGAGYDWADVDSDPNDVMVGVKGSRVFARVA